MSGRKSPRCCCDADSCLARLAWSAPVGRRRVRVIRPVNSTWRAILSHDRLESCERLAPFQGLRGQKRCEPAQVRCHELFPEGHVVPARPESPATGLRKEAMNCRAVPANLSVVPQSTRIGMADSAGSPKMLLLAQSS